MLSQAPVAFRNTWWARAWGVDGNTSFPYNGPKTVGSAGRWLFLLINTMRHALLSATGFRYFAKPELDGIVCVDSMVQTLRLAAAWRHSLFAGFMRPLKPIFRQIPKHMFPRVSLYFPVFMPTPLVPTPSGALRGERRVREGLG